MNPKYCSNRFPYGKAQNDIMNLDCFLLSGANLIENIWSLIKSKMRSKFVISLQELSRKILKLRRSLSS